MDSVDPRVAGIDVHKKIIWVAVRLPGAGPGERAVTVRRFATFWRLASAGIEVCVCNAAHMRNVPGRKTDLRDCQWIAELHEHGLLRPSFIPAAEVAALRQRTRYRKKLIESRGSELQRLAKVLEDGGVKIDSVASSLTTVSARDMIEAMIAGERDPAVLAGLARGVMRKKISELEMACDG